MRAHLKRNIGHIGVVLTVAIAHIRRIDARVSDGVGNSAAGVLGDCEDVYKVVEVFVRDHSDAVPTVKVQSIDDF